MKIYVASSWRNDHQPTVVAALRAVGHDVYDFKNPHFPDVPAGAPGEGFAWSSIDPAWHSWTPAKYLKALAHPLSQDGFADDMNALRNADATVLVMPSGRSAHIEAGYAAGAGQRLIILLDDLSWPSPGHTQPYCKACGEIEIRHANVVYTCRERHRRAVAREPELMYKMAELITSSLADVIGALEAKAKRALHKAEADLRAHLTAPAPGPLTVHLPIAPRSRAPYGGDHE